MNAFDCNARLHFCSSLSVCVCVCVCLLRACGIVHVTKWQWQRQWQRLWCKTQTASAPNSVAMTTVVKTNSNHAECSTHMRPVYSDATTKQR